MDALDRLVGRLCVALVGLACALLFGMMLAICADVFLRNLAVPGMPRGFALASDLSESAIYLMTLLAAPFLLRSGRHIRIDILLHVVPRADRLADGVVCRLRDAVLLRGDGLVRLRGYRAKCGQRCNAH